MHVYSYVLCICIHVYVYVCVCTEGLTIHGADLRGKTNQREYETMYCCSM